jgi:hypothetical protein
MIDTDILLAVNAVVTDGSTLTVQLSEWQPAAEY